MADGHTTEAGAGCIGVDRGITLSQDDKNAPGHISWLGAKKLPNGCFFLLGSCDFTIEFGASIVEDIEFIFPDDENTLFLIAERGVDIGVENRFFFSVGLCQNVAIRSDDETMTQKARPTLLPNTIGGNEENAVLGGPGTGDKIRVEGGGAGPGRRDQYHLGTHEGKRTTRLGEA